MAADSVSVLVDALETKKDQLQHIEHLQKIVLENPGFVSSFRKGRSSINMQKWAFARHEEEILMKMKEDATREGNAKREDAKRDAKKEDAEKEDAENKRFKQRASDLHLRHFWYLAPIFNPDIVGKLDDLYWEAILNIALKNLGEKQAPEDLVHNICDKWLGYLKRDKYAAVLLKEEQTRSHREQRSTSGMNHFL